MIVVKVGDKVKYQNGLWDVLEVRRFGKPVEASTNLFDIVALKSESIFGRCQVYPRLLEKVDG